MGTLRLISSNEWLSIGCGLIAGYFLSLFIVTIIHYFDYWEISKFFHLSFASVSLAFIGEIFGILEVQHKGGRKKVIPIVGLFINSFIILLYGFILFHCLFPQIRYLVAKVLKQLYLL